MVVRFRFFGKFGTKMRNFFGQRGIFLEALSFGSTATAVNATLLGALSVLFTCGGYFQVLIWVVWE